MSRGYDFDNREDNRDQEPEQPSQPGSRPPVYGRTGGDSSNPERRRSEQRWDRDRSAPRRERVKERPSMRSIEKWHGLSDRERATRSVRSGASAPSTPRRCPNTATPASRRHSRKKLPVYNNEGSSSGAPFPSASIATRS